MKEESELKGGLEQYITLALERRKNELISSSPTDESEYSPEKDLASLLLPMKGCIYAKFGKVSLTEEEWKCNNRSRPLLFQGTSQYLPFLLNLTFPNCKGYSFYGYVIC